MYKQLERYFKTELYPLQNIFLENFCPVCENLCGYGRIKMRTKKKILFHGEEKTYKSGQKWILWKSTFS